MGIEVGLIFKIAGVGIVIAFINTLLEQINKKEYSQWVTLFGFIYILFMVIVLVTMIMKKDVII